MTLYELEQQLAFARQMGAEDNDIVYINTLVRVFEARPDDDNRPNDTEIESYHEQEEPNRAVLKRCGKREIVLE